MNDQPSKTPGDEADAEYLFGDSIGPAETQNPVQVEPAASEGYEVEGLDEVEDEPQAPPVPVAPKPRNPQRRPARADGEPPDEDDPKPKLKSKRSEAEESAVSEPWSRGAEWGSTLVVVGVALFLTFWLAYTMLSPTSIGLMILVLVGGLAVTLGLAYPIFVTLERPVRMTPEQALKDFLAALSHSRPHYKRMWLLLSDRGKNSGPFDDFSGFQNYWRQSRSELKAQAPRGSGMLTFSVVDFKSEKSAGQTVIDGTATIHATAGDDAKPLAVFWGKMWFVRGPDRMWYLNQGYLPDPAPEQSA